MATVQVLSSEDLQHSVRGDTRDFEQLPMWVEVDLVGDAEVEPVGSIFVSRSDKARRVAVPTRVTLGNTRIVMVRISAPLTVRLLVSRKVGRVNRRPVLGST
jgi:hypothetical protein